MIVINARFLTQAVTGVQRYAEQISLALKRLRDDVVFVTPHDIHSHAIAEALQARCIGRLRGHLWEQIDLPRYLRQQGNPLLVSLCSTGPVFYANQIATHHDITYVRFPATYSWQFRTAYRLMTPLLLARVRTLLTPSEFSKGEISRFYKIDPDRILTIPNAVIEHFRPDPQAQVERPYLLAVSSPSVHKNFARMIQAFLSLRGQPDLQLHIVGSTHGLFAEPDLQRLASRDPRIRFLGRLDDQELLTQYQGATAFVFPSLYEGFGIPPLEAQACGCPVLAARAASIPEVLRDSALYFDPLDIGQMAAAMQRILHDPALRQSLRRQGLANVERFSWQRSAQRLSLHIDTLLATHARQRKTANGSSK